LNTARAFSASRNGWSTRCSGEVVGLDEATRAALERAEEKVVEHARPLGDNVVALASRRR